MFYTIVCENNFNFQDVHRGISLYLHVNINCQVVYSEGQPIFHIFLNFCNAVKEEIVSIQSMVNITALVPTAEKKAGPQTFLFSLVLKSLLTIKLKTLE